MKAGDRVRFKNQQKGGVKMDEPAYTDVPFLVEPGDEGTVVEIDSPEFVVVEVLNRVDNHPTWLVVYASELD